MTNRGRRCVMPEDDLTGKVMVCNSRPYEFVCPKCGYIAGSDSVKGEWVTVIQRKSNKVRCHKCDNIIEVSGFWCTDRRSKRGRFIAVPYTLLSYQDSL